MAYYVEPMAKLVNEFNRMPGIGEKTAQRLAFYILNLPVDDAKKIAETIVHAREKIFSCGVCGNFTDQDPCKICANTKRDRSVICVVEETKDLLAMERIREYNGLYHVLQGAISPLDGIGPEDLRIRELLQRLENDEIKEVILATNPNIPGDTTSMYLARLLKPLGIKVTRIARGLPIGGDLEYADQVTLSRALEGRREI